MKSNTKQILHKVGKQWVTISTFTLMLLGALGGSTLIGHADNTQLHSDVNAVIASNDQNHQISHNGTGFSGYSSEMPIHPMINAKLEQSRSQDDNNHVQLSSLPSSEQTYLKNNRAFNNDGFTGISNGHGQTFLTANSWYRPKMIHQNGANWRPSTSSQNDYRPILMNWWPDKTTLAGLGDGTNTGYLGYMQKNGFISPSEDFEPSDSTSKLLSGAEEAQDNIEKEISQTSNTNWLHRLMNGFIFSNDQWNIYSEDPHNDGLQGGFLKFVNNDLTPNANSNYRYIGRAGDQYHRTHNTNDVMEFLLGNDIDNSNPKVQAEDLNNIYYINNIGSLHGGAPDENFDGFREDATGSMDYDVTDLLSQYMKDTYHLGQNDGNTDNHLNVLEDASNFIPDIRNNEALHQDENMLFNLRAELLYKLSNPANTDFSEMIHYNDGNYNINRSKDDTENSVLPNYTRVNLHDNDSFIDPITQAFQNILINDEVQSNSNHVSVQQARYAVAQAVQQYEDGINTTEKPSTQYRNIPSAYAYMLTNKDTVPQIYYGDLFYGNQPYMSTKTPFYDAITTLLKARKRYVAGGQQMNQQRIDGSNYLSSVRFGKDSSFANDSNNSSYNYGGQILNSNEDPHNDGSVKTGIAVVIGNNPSADPTDNMTVNMGKAHANQQYQVLVHSTNNGVDTTDHPVLTSPTDANGDLTVPAQYLKGVANPQVSGSLVVLVPTGNTDPDGARTLNATYTPQDGNLYHSNAVLDSHVMYESFSPFMPINAPEDQKLDYVMAHDVPNTSEKTANWLQKLGITDFKFPPHYKPLTDDSSFIDAIDQNGYAFSDRYNMNNTKYGSLNDLLAANKVLHQNSNIQEPIHTMADLVLNQIYDLPGKEPVAVDRVDTLKDGAQDSTSNITNLIYLNNADTNPNLSNTDDPVDYQNQYGGKYLSQLQSQYPDLFNTNEISTGQHINPTTPIKDWSAKYMNGSNIQGRGDDYILHKNMDSGDPSNDDYYINGSNVPEVFLDGSPVDYGASSANNPQPQPNPVNNNNVNNIPVTPAPMPNIPSVPSNNSGNLNPTGPLSPSNNGEVDNTIPVVNTTSENSTNATKIGPNSSVTGGNPLNIQTKDNNTTGKKSDNNVVDHHNSQTSLKTKSIPNTHINLEGVKRNALLYVNNRVISLNHKSMTNAKVVEAIQRGHHVTYMVKVGNVTGRIYGSIKKVAKPVFMNHKIARLHYDHKVIKVNSKQVKVIKSIRRANHVKYYVKVNKKYGYIYSKLPNIKKTVFNSHKVARSTNDVYYRYVPKYYNYVEVLRPIHIYDSKRFNQRTNRGFMRKGITTRIQRLVKYGNITRFELMNGKYITSNKRWVRLTK